MEAVSPAAESLVVGQPGIGTVAFDGRRLRGLAFVAGVVAIAFALGAVVPGASPLLWPVGLGLLAAPLARRRAGPTPASRSPRAACCVRASRCSGCASRSATSPRSAWAASCSPPARSR
jgi:hypothetical protein